MAFFFPDGQNQSNKKAYRTLALIRPSAFAQHYDDIVKRIKESGFTIAMTKTVEFDRQQAEDFYSEHKEKPFFEDLVKEMTRFIFCLYS